MNNIYFVRWHDNRTGVGPTWSDAVKAILGEHEYQKFIDAEQRGYNWSGYLQRNPPSGQSRKAPVSSARFSYECCTVSTRNNTYQICEVFRSPYPEAIRNLTDRYGEPSRLSTPDFARVAKRVKPRTAAQRAASAATGKAKTASSKPSRDKRSSARRVA